MISKTYSSPYDELNDAQRALFDTYRRVLSGRMRPGTIYPLGRTTVYHAEQPSVEWTCAYCGGCRTGRQCSGCGAAKS